MAWPSSLNVALKEWSVVCRALESGRQIALLRKGGISESNGQFVVQNRQFLLFPTYLHQNVKMLKEADRAGFEARASEPDEVVITSAGLITDVVQLKSRAQVETIDDEHVWTSLLLDMRFNYKPESPLYLLLVRAHRLHEPIVVANTPSYAGCKSWVPLDHSIGTGNALPVLDDVRYEARRKSILDRLG